MPASRTRVAMCRVVVAGALVGLGLGCDLNLTPFVEAGGAPDPPRSIDSGRDAPIEPDLRDGASDSGDGGPLDGGRAKRVFVASAKVAGKLGGLAGGDAICQQAARQASLGGTFIAWLSVPGTSALSRIEDVGPWYLVDRATLVFSTRAAIPGTGALVPIDRDEKGAIVELAAPNQVWTGTSPSGDLAANHCDGFTKDERNAQGQYGKVVKGPNWTDRAAAGCDSQLHLYCFEQ